MRLTDLNPEFFGAGGEGISTAAGDPVPRRHGVGMVFDCPCGKCGVQCQVEFTVAIDGNPWRLKAWNRTGATFETMTLQPSIHRAKRLGGCGWHGWIRNGEVTGV